MSENNNLPWILASIDMLLNDKQMLEKMLEIFTQIGATPIDNTITQNSFIIIKKSTSIIHNICSIFFRSTANIPKIQVIFRFMQNKYNRLVEIKSLQGFVSENETLIINYLKKCIPFSKSIKIIRFSPGHFSNIEEELQNEYMDLIEKQGNKVKNSNILSINININNFNKNNNLGLNNSRNNFIDENTNMFQKINKHASTYYEIYKILSQNNYDVGKIMTSFINEFKIKNEHIEKNYMRLPEQMKEIINTRNICNDTFSNYFNMGKAFRLNDDMAKQSLTAIDNYIFNKLYFQLYELYDRKYQKENEEFLYKKRIINENYSIKEIMDNLGIKPQFQCIEEYENSGHSPLCLPFKSTIDNMNKIEYEQNPNIKFNTLIEAGLELRNTILGNSNNKKDLNSMDDELPIFIYCSTQINTKNAPAEYHMIEDYIKFSDMNINESKVLTNSMGAILYISKQWNNFQRRKSSEDDDDNIFNEDEIKHLKKSWNKKDYEYNEEKSEENIFLDDMKEVKKSS
jgi:DNA-directed RNA polymerase subunit N (RpoN/RPB10)